MQLRFKQTPRSKNIQLNGKGIVTVRLLGEDQFEVVKLKRTDLTLKIDDFEGGIQLIFTKKF